MPLPRLAVGWLACMLLAWHALPGRAETPAADPLRLVPAQADVVLTAGQPGKLLEAFTALEQVKQLYQLEALREYFDSTNIRRLNQLITYFEKTLGVPRAELLDRLAGGGVAAAVKFAPDPAPALLVVQGKDEKLARQFLKLAVEVIEEELARQDNKGRAETSTYRGVEGVKIGDKLFFAAAGSALLAASNVQTLQAAIDLHLDGDQNSLARSPRLAEGRMLLPGTPLAWLWLNVEKVREQPQFKVVFDTFASEPATVLVLGGFPDIIRRSPCLTAGLYREADGFSLRLRYPRGRDGMSEPSLLVLPGPEDAAPPLLEPKNVQFSAGIYLDLGKAYANRSKLLKPEALKGLAEVEKKAAPFVGKLQEVLTQAGTHGRFVSIAQGATTIYKQKPKLRLDAYGFVQEMRDPAFAKTIEAALRAAATFASFQLGLKSGEPEMHGEHTLVVYRFDEGREIKQDKDSVRFNFSPCFGQVGNQFFVASTVELGRELADLLQKEAGRTEKQSAGLRGLFHWSSLAAALRANQEPLMTQAVLKQALPPDVARKETQLLVNVIDSLGTARLETAYDANVTRYDIRLTFGKACCCDE